MQWYLWTIINDHKAGILWRLFEYEVYILLPFPRTKRARGKKSIKPTVLHDNEWNERNSRKFENEILKFRLL